MLISMGSILHNTRPFMQHTAPMAGLLADKELSAGVEIPPVDVSVGFSGADLSYALAPGSNPLPGGLSLAPATGLITGTPAQDTPPRMVRIRAVNSGGHSEGAFFLSVLTPTIARNPDNSLSLIAGADGGPVDVTITSDALSGTYAIDPGATPTALNEMTIANTQTPQDNTPGVVGDMFHVQMPVTVFDAAATPPAATGQWYLDGLALPHATGDSLTVPDDGALDYRALIDGLSLVSNTVTITQAPPIATLDGLVGGPTPNVVPTTTRTTHTSVSLGPARPARTLYVVALMRRVNVTGVELTPAGGQTYMMTPVDGAVADNGADMIALYKAQVPEGESADIELISNGTSPTGRSSVAVYAARGVSSEGSVTKIEAAQAPASATDDLSLTIAQPGFVLAAGFGINTVDHAGWIGAIEDGVMAIQAASPFSLASGPVSPAPAPHQLSYSVVNNLARVALAVAVS